MNENDLNFDQQVIEQLSEIIPPEEEIRRTNPWSKPIDFITWGLILATLHLNFLYLQYILPTIGVILIFLGFRSLRNENIYFKVLWVFSIIMLFSQLTELVSVSTPLNIVDYPELALGTVMVAFQIAMFLIFHKALKETFKKANKPMTRSPLLWASLWTVASFFIALSPLNESWLVFIPMIVFYVLIVRSLLQVGEQLDDTGYVLTNAPVSISSRTFGWSYFLIALAVVITCNAYYNHLKLEPQEYQPPNITAARQHLLDMEFPAEALQYLSDEDVALLVDAVNVEVFNKMLMFDPRKVEHREGSEGYMYIIHTYEPGKRNIQASTIYIEMPENVVYVMQYFTWLEGNPVWQDGIVIHGESKEVDADDKEIISSGLFYSKKGIKYTADFPRLVCEPITINTMFGTYYTVPIIGALSYPFGSESQGGYVLYRYTVKADSNIFATYAIFNYVHLLSPLRIPYARTEEMILGGAYVFEDELNQHYTNYESMEFKERNRNPYSR